MTREEFVEQAKAFGYSDGQIACAISGMLELKRDYGIDIDYDGIVIHPLSGERRPENKFVWQDGEVVIYRPKKAD